MAIVCVVMKVRLIPLANHLFSGLTNTFKGTVSWDWIRPCMVLIWVCPPRLGTKGGATLACGWGGRGSQFGRLKRKPGTLSTLWAPSLHSNVYVIIYFILVHKVINNWFGKCAGTHRRYDMNGRFQKQGGKNWILPKETNANLFFWDSLWLEIWSNHFCPSMGPNGGSVGMESGWEIYTEAEN